MELILDGERFGNGNQVMNYVANAMKFPHYFGGNLDALYDCLTERHEEVVIRLKNWPDYGRLYRIAFVMQKAAEENGNLKIIME